MRILALRPGVDDPRRRFRLRAIFDVQLDDDVRLFGLHLMQAPDGRHLTFAPSKHGQKVATFSPDMAQRLTELATKELEGIDARFERAA